MFSLHFCAVSSSLYESQITQSYFKLLIESLSSRFYVKTAVMCYFVRKVTKQLTVVKL